jgi:hypothetical protein
MIVCPNCGGGFCKRPVRPSQNLINGNYLGNHPATTVATHKPIDGEQHALFTADIKTLVAGKQ